MPFSGGTIPRDRISPQAAALLNYYPLPNAPAGDRYNFQVPHLAVTHQDAVQARFAQPPLGRNQFFGNIAIQRTTTESTNVFGFTDTTSVSGWIRRSTGRSGSAILLAARRYQFTSLGTDVTVFCQPLERIRGCHRRQQPEPVTGVRPL